MYYIPHIQLISRSELTAVSFFHVSFRNTTDLTDSTVAATGPKTRPVEESHAILDGL